MDRKSTRKHFEDSDLYRFYTRILPFFKGMGKMPAMFVYLRMRETQHTGTLAMEYAEAEGKAE